MSNESQRAGIENNGPDHVKSFLKEE
jgi:hypothetical protein